MHLKTFHPQALEKQPKRFEEIEKIVVDGCNDFMWNPNQEKMEIKLKIQIKNCGQNTVKLYSFTIKKLSGKREIVNGKILVEKMCSYKILLEKV